jgi:hypothetical protein
MKGVKRFIARLERFLAGSSNFPGQFPLLALERAYSPLPTVAKTPGGLSRNPKEILLAGKFMIPQSEEFESAMNKEFEQVKAGF